MSEYEHVLAVLMPFEYHDSPTHFLLKAACLVDEIYCYDQYM